MKILFLSRWFPYPANNGSKLRIFNILRGLARHHELILLSFTDSTITESFPPELQAICAEIYTVPFQTFNPKSIKARLGWFSLSPRSIVDTYSQEMSEKIKEIIVSHRPDFIIASQIDTALYFKSFMEIPALFEEVENCLLYERYVNSSSMKDRIRYGLTWLKYSRFLKNLLKGYGACTVVSEREKELLVKMNTGIDAIEVVPNCINIQDYFGVNEIPQANILIFTGSFNYYPNYEAMVWFVNHVFPIIESQIPDIKLFITGDHGNRFLSEKSNIVLTGYVKDVKSLIAKSWISVVPILSGGGTRLKILEAMGLRTPVVTTTKGAEGLSVRNGSNILIGDSPAEFAAHITKLTNEPAMREEIAKNALQFVRDHYEWSIVLPKILTLIENLPRAKRNYR